MGSVFTYNTFKMEGFYNSYRRDGYDHFEAMREAMLDAYGEWEEKVCWKATPAWKKRTARMVWTNNGASLIYTKKTARMTWKKTVIYV